MIVYGVRWCLHKRATCSEFWEVTRVMDPARVFLARCGGIFTEPREEPS